MSRPAIRVLGFIGAGRMGLAIATALIRKRVYRPNEILLADPSPSARRSAARLGCRVTEDSCDVMHASHDIVLAIKPQKIEEVSALIGPHASGHRIISILAGTTRRRLSQILNDARVIRVMPNTPLLVDRGATAIARDGVAGPDLRFTQSIFSAVGRVYIVPEKWMNAVTALSGSGPAVLCAFLESYTRAANRGGLPPAMAADMARQTFIGTAALLLMDPTLSPRYLREQVTSPGGTTEAALSELSRRRMDDVVFCAFRAAVSRGKQLSR